MFEWLEEEIALIRNKKFHMVDGPADQSLEEAIENSNLLVPPAYRQFVIRFGNVKLYRQLDYYKVGVLASPREEIHQATGETYFRFGHYDSASAYFKESLMHGEEETPVFEGRGGRFQQVAEGFEAWLSKRCTASRRKYKKQQWAEIIAGPPPFSPEEQMIVEARRQFTCRTMGISAAGSILFEVHNGSRTTLPFLSVGVRWRDNSLQGGIWLPVSHVRPGTTALVEHEVYMGLSQLSEIEVFELPDPEPEDRERFWEFKGAQ